MVYFFQPVFYDITDENLSCVEPVTTYKVTTSNIGQHLENTSVYNGHNKAALWSQNFQSPTHALSGKH